MKSIMRRRVIAGAAAAALGMPIGAAPQDRGAAATRPHRIDVHHHVVPPVWADALPSHGGDPSGWRTPVWCPASDLALMDRLAIRTAMLSLTSPGVDGWRGEEQAAMARRVNEYTAELVRSYPGRYGHFATLPLDRIDAALRELEYSLDTLRADGVVLLSNHDGVYPGEARYRELWAELDRRAAVVFVHPTMPRIDLIPGLLGPIVDYPFDTTRAALSLVAGGVLTRHPRVKVILSHAGGFLPYGAYRFAGSIAALQPARSIDSLIAEMRRFHFDVAVSSSATVFPSLMAFAEPGSVLYGSDVPYARDARVIEYTAYLDRYDGFAPGQLAAIDRSSALPLFPRLAAA